MRRSEAHASIPTRYIYELIQDRISQNRLEAASQLYDLFLQHPKTMASAGYALGDAIHDLLSRGGYWEILPLSKSRRKGSKNTHWKTHSSPTENAHLFLGHREGISTISTTPPQGEFTPQELEMIPFRSNIKALRSGYYFPESPNQDTIDAFIYNTTTTCAMLFQSTTSTNPHSFKGDVVERLKGLGAQRFYYIAVTPPGKAVHIVIPNEFCDDIPEVYQLILARTK
jgi:hypothetical protein